MLNTVCPIRSRIFVSILALGLLGCQFSTEEILTISIDETDWIPINDENADQELALPIYRYHAGQRLHFHEQIETKVESGEAYLENHHLFITVLNETTGADDRREWELLIESDHRMESFDSGGRRRSAGESVKRFCRQTMDQFGATSPIVRSTVDATWVFPPLPRTRDELTEGWSGAGTRLNKQSKLLLKACAVKDRLLMELDVAGPMHTAAEASELRQITYDPEQGGVSRVEITKAEKNGSSQVRGVITLEEITQLEPDELASLRARVAEYFAILAKDKRQRELHGTDLARAEEVYRLANQHLEENAKRITHPELRADLNRRIESYQERMNSAVATATRRSAFIGRESPTWELEDLQGEVHSSGDLNGNVVVLDFWYRGCVWCVLQMPDLSELATKYESRGVRFVGMNTDDDPGDARAVIESMAPNYLQLRAKSVTSDFGVTSYPTMIIVGSDGTIRDYRTGFEDSLAEELSSALDRLLEHGQ